MKYYTAVPYRMNNGITIFHIPVDGKTIVVAEGLGLQVSRVAEYTPNLGPYDEKSFAEFARMDIAKRVLAGE